MINSQKAVTDINRIAVIDNKDAQSHYKKLNKGNIRFSIRVSDHHTVLATWVLSNYNLPESKNITIVFLDRMTQPSREDNKVSYTAFNSEKWHVAFPDENKEEFEVLAYVYDCEKLEEIDVTMIGNQLRNFFNGFISNFSDPLYDERDKKAKKYLLKSNQRPKDISESVSDDSFENYIYDIVMSMYFPDEIKNPDTTENVESIQENYMSVGPYQNKSGIVNIKPAQLINLYK